MDAKEQKIKKLIEEAKKLLTPELVEKFKKDLSPEQFKYLTSIFLIEFGKMKINSANDKSRVPTPLPAKIFASGDASKNTGGIQSWAPAETIKTWDGEKFVYVKKSLIDKKA